MKSQKTDLDDAFALSFEIFVFGRRRVITFVFI